MRYLTIFFMLFVNVIYAQHIFKDVEITSQRTIKSSGIDVSFYQGKIDWSKIDTSISFVICKASESVNKKDPKFKYNWDSCRVKKGAYHFFRPLQSGVDQANLFLSVVPFKSGDIIPVIDVEMTPSWTRIKNRKLGATNLNKMVKEIKKKLGVDPIIYTTGHFWDKYVQPYYKGDHILWIADHRKLNEPKTPSNMPIWYIWQYTHQAKVAGVHGLVDKNICKNIDSILIK